MNPLRTTANGRATNPQHISTAPTYPAGPNTPAVFEPHGMCSCPSGFDPQPEFPIQCRRCFRPELRKP